MFRSALSPSNPSLPPPSSSSSSSSGSFAVKLRLPTGEIRRISLPSPPTFASLLSRLDPSDLSDLAGTVRMTYLDEEGDRVSVACDEDLREAFLHMPAGRNALLLEVEGDYAGTSAFLPIFPDLLSSSPPPYSDLPDNPSLSSQNLPVPSPSSSQTPPPPLSPTTPDTHQGNPPQPAQLAFFDELAHLLLSLLSSTPFFTRQSASLFLAKVRRRLVHLTRLTYWHLRRLSFFGLLRLVVLIYLMSHLLLPAVLQASRLTGMILWQVLIVLWYLVLIKIAWTVLREGGREVARRFGF